MPTLVVPASVSPEQIDDFPESCKRESALYIRPASTVEVTADELKHLKGAHPKLLSKLIIHKPGPSLADRIAQRKAQQPTRAPAPAPVTAPQPTRKKESKPSPSKKEG